MDDRPPLEAPDASMDVGGVDVDVDADAAASGHCKHDGTTSTTGMRGRATAVGAHALVLVAVLAIAGVWWSWRWLDLFPLVEFRQQLRFQLPWSWVVDNLTFRGDSIWPVPLLFNRVVGKACDSNIACDNGMLLGLNLLSASCLFLFVLGAMRNRAAAAAAAALWLIGIPAMDTMAWQATNFDKLSALACVSGALIGWSWWRRPFSARNAVLGNLSLLPVAVVGYASKPAAWVLIPALVLMPLLAGGQRWRSWWWYLVLPALYAIPQSLHVLSLVNDDPFYDAHVSSGDPVENGRRFLAYLSGSLHPGSGSVLIFAVLLGVIVLGFRWSETREPARLGAWAMAVCIGSLVIPLRTEFGAPFYLMVPSAFFVIGVVAAYRIIISRLPRPWLVIPLLVLHGWYFADGLRDSDWYYSMRDQQSEHFRDALAVLRVEMPRGAPGTLAFVVDDANSQAFFFVRMNDLEEYVYGSKSEVDSRMVEMVRSEFDASEPDPASAYALFDIDMRLQQVIVYGDVVWTRAAAAD